MTKMSFALVFCLLSTSTFACENQYYGVTNDVTLPESYSLFLDCTEKMPELVLSENDEYNYETLSQPDSHSYSDYWSDWVLKTDSNPLVSQNFSDSYFGIGVWSPTELNEDDEITTQEWLMNHGLQFSVGFGEKKLGEPRFRLDYMWHEDEKDNVMMQVELPF